MTSQSNCRNSKEILFLMSVWTLLICIKNRLTAISKLLSIWMGSLKRNPRSVPHLMNMNSQNHYLQYWHRDPFHLQQVSSRFSRFILGMFYTNDTGILDGVQSSIPESIQDINKINHKRSFSPLRLFSIQPSIIASPEISPVIIDEFYDVQTQEKILPSLTFSSTYDNVSMDILF